MTTRGLLTAAALALAAGTLAASSPAMAASAGRTVPRGAAAVEATSRGGVFQRAPGTRPVRVHGHVINFSNNWSGYAVVGGTFTTATASWTQTAATCPGGGQDSSPWVGIDGFTSPTVEQTGTDGDCVNGKPSYYAWYELFPRGTQVIHHPVNPGDQFTGTVTHTGGTNYTLTLTDTTQHWSATFHKSISGKNNSAEAVMERDGSKLADFGTGPFTSFTVDGKPIGSYTAAPFTIEQMQMKVGATLCDNTSGLTNSEDFTVTWQNEC